VAHQGFQYACGIPVAAARRRGQRSLGRGQLVDDHRGGEGQPDQLPGQGSGSAFDEPFQGVLGAAVEVGLAPGSGRVDVPFPDQVGRRRRRARRAGAEWVMTSPPEPILLLPSARQ